MENKTPEVDVPVTNVVDSTNAPPGTDDSSDESYTDDNYYSLACGCCECCGCYCYNDEEVSD